MPGVNNKIKLVVFDLDGTLISSHKTIYKATIHALNLLNIKNKLVEEKFYSRIGLHFEDIFNEFGIKVPNFEDFIRVYRSVYFDYIDLSKMYEGVENTIDDLKKLEIKIGLLTTKSQDQAELILRYFNIHHKFDYIMGRRIGISHKPSPEPLLYICNDMNIKPVNTIIVGDSELDVMCGKEANALTCAVTYGYRKKDELNKVYPDFIIDKISDIIKIVDGNV